ncbi:MAG: hypothetical protein WC637_15820 [Victivallales bacterium]|jgi:hypothetical protein
MKKNRTANTLTAFLLLGFLFGCETLDTEKAKKDPSYVLTINEIVKQQTRSKEIEKDVPTFGGKTICVNTNAFLHSRNVQEIEIIPSAERKGFYDLELRLDYHGKNIWMQLSVNKAFTKLGFLIDGVYYSSIMPDKISTEDDDIVYLRGPFDPVTAKALKDNARSNYKYFNGEPKER